MSASNNALPEDTVDDILYFARAGDSTDLSSTLKSVASDPTNGFTSELQVLLSAHDVHSGNNALHMASANGHLETVRLMLSLLPPLAANDPPHALVAHKNAAGNTPLHWAALNGHLEVVKLLLVGANADPTVMNASGHDAVYEAESNDRREVVEWVLGEFAGLEKAVGGAGGGIGEEEEEEEGPAVEDGMGDMRIGEDGVEES